MHLIGREKFAGSASQPGTPIIVATGVASLVRKCGILFFSVQVCTLYRMLCIRHSTRGFRISFSSRSMCHHIIEAKTCLTSRRPYRTAFCVGTSRSSFAPIPPTRASVAALRSPRPPCASYTSPLPSTGATRSTAASRTRRANGPTL